MNDDNCNVYQANSGGFNPLLFESSADCIKIIDLEGRLVQLNPGGIDALELDDPTQLDGKYWADFWPEDTRDTVHAAVRGALSGERANFGAFCPTSKGSERWWDVVVSPIRDSGGAVSQLMVVSRDVTDLHLARVALQDANRRKDEFLALLSHELRNPLAAAGMAATVLQTQSLSASRVNEIGKLVERQVQHMSRLAEDLLDVSRVTRGDIRLQLERVDMNDVIRAALEQLNAAINAREHVLAFTACSDACHVMGDRTRLIQVVGNVVGNAVRYTPPGGSIALDLARSADAIRLDVHDSGMGIAAEDIPALFELYKKASHADERKSGLGIGLALVRSILELHQGTVEACSEGPGKGSTFTLTLPAA